MNCIISKRQHLYVGVLSPISTAIRKLKKTTLAAKRGSLLFQYSFTFHFSQRKIPFHFRTLTRLLFIHIVCRILFPLAAVFSVANFDGAAGCAFLCSLSAAHESRERETTRRVQKLKMSLLKTKKLI